MWVNATLYAKILRLLRKCLKRHKVQRRHRVVVMADAFGGHLTLRAMQKINKYRFYFVLLSAGLTWLLQPLDVQTFVCVKRFLRDRYAQVPEHEPEPRLILTSLRDLLAAIAKLFRTCGLEQCLRLDWIKRSVPTIQQIDSHRARVGSLPTDTSGAPDRRSHPTKHPRRPPAPPRLHRWVFASATTTRDISAKKITDSMGGAARNPQSKHR